MAYQSAVTPNLGFMVLAGNCLAMAQGIVGAMVAHNSATDAANSTNFRHYDTELPDAICVLWFDHWGRYGYPGQEVWANWGHVVIYVPGYGFLSSSPVGGETSTPYYYSSINQVERAFNCTYRFWSEDINGLRVCSPKPSAVARRKKTKMLMAYCADAAGKGKGRWAIFGPQFWLEIETQSSADALAGQLGVKAHVVGKAGWDKYRRVAGA